MKCVRTVTTGLLSMLLRTRTNHLQNLVDLQPGVAQLILGFLQPIFEPFVLQDAFFIQLHEKRKVILMSAKKFKGICR